MARLPSPPKEAEVLKQCLQWLKLHGVLCWRQNQGAMQAEHKGKRRFLRFAGIDGISDIVGVLPPGGKLLAVECKRRGNKPTEAQRRFLDAVTAAGGIAICVTSVEELADALQLGE